MPRPAGVKFFSINIVPEGTPKKIIGRFKGRQNPAFDLCIGKTYDGKCEEWALTEVRTVCSEVFLHWPAGRAEPESHTALPAGGVVVRRERPGRSVQSDVESLKAAMPSGLGAATAVPRSKKREPVSRPSRFYLSFEGTMRTLSAKAGERFAMRMICCNRFSVDGVAASQRSMSWK